MTPRPHLLTPITPLNEADVPLSPVLVFKNLLALGSIFWAGYVWLVLTV